MAGYQNNYGFSGGDLDRILNDYNVKSTPTFILFAINGDSWDGTEDAGIYPANDYGTVEQFPTYDPADPYQELNSSLEFTLFDSNRIYAQIQSKVDMTDRIHYIVPFIGLDKYGNPHQYLLNIKQTKSISGSAVMTYFRIKAVVPLY